MARRPLSRNGSESVHVEIDDDDVDEWNQNDTDPPPHTTKAFDTVDTDILLCKLRLLNLSESSVTWFESYLRERQQCVIACDYSSK
ncbi:hypothetical protein ANN_05115 [Periplaneta americana]|uniref:Uncharacterized protein n=1 Tax=Periplaneta americana TaxID=6978 RepID=A0ABQ8TBW0_PERAM|nr:hypothetical protein ANN_05115 [Periplaneta americana]